ncbi:MAG: DegT/DnrJ/EryC1/StrS family aminotransferase [Planctomyces sp.]
MSLLNTNRISVSASADTKMEQELPDIPLVDLKQQVFELEDEIHLAIQQVVDRCDFILGKAVAEFESAFAAWTGVRHAVGVASGLDALTLSLSALGVTAGDEVIVPVNTFTATAMAVVAAGAKPVFVDCDPDSYLMNLKHLDSVVTSATRAIIPVHLTGQPADMESVIRFAERFSLAVVEDAAQAHGARYQGIACGAFGNAGCFSFYPGKNLGGFGDGGMITTNDERLASKLRCLRNYGQRQKYEHVLAGTNSRLDTIQAAVLNVKLPRMDDWNLQRATKAALYREGLKDVGDLVIQAPLPNRTHVYHLFIIETEDRDGLLQHLNSGGIQAAIHYPVPLHLQPAYSHLGYKKGDFPEAERLAGRVLSLPMFPQMTEAQVDRVCQRVCSWFS